MVFQPAQPGGVGPCAHGAAGQRAAAGRRAPGRRRHDAGGGRSPSSQARYRVREQLASVSFPIDAVGTTRDISGVVVFAEDGRVLADRSSITVNVTRLQSDQARRDNFIRTNTLETQRYPEVHFIPTEVRGLPMPLPAEGEVPITIAGELTIKNVTRPVQWTGTATFTPEGMTVSANTVITFEEFQIAKPRVHAGPQRRGRNPAGSGRPFSKAVVTGGDPVSGSRDFLRPC